MADELIGIIGGTGRKTRDMTSMHNPTQKELRAGIYKPRLTLMPRITFDGTWDTLLKIELSLPKLLFGNNFDELSNKDFTALVDALACSLLGMGILVTPEALTEAPINGIHYAKNIPLTDGSTPYHFITKIKDANIKLSLDVNQTDYRNDGHCYKWHCNAYEVVFYDKIRDLEKAKISAKRAVEKESALQLNLLGTFKKRKKLEILRMEVRLNKRAKIAQLFEQLGIRAKLTFSGLFKTSIAKKVLLYYLGELERLRSPLLDYRAKSDKELLAMLAAHNPELSAKKIMQLYGLKKALEAMTPRELRGMFAKSTGRSWHRIMAQAQDVRLPLAKSDVACRAGRPGTKRRLAQNSLGHFGVMRKKIMQFKSVRLEKFFV